MYHDYETLYVQGGLIGFYYRVNVTYKRKCGMEPNSSQHKKEGIRDYSHVAKVETPLDHTFHA